MGILLTGGQHWSQGYLYIGIAQFVLTAVIILSLSLWKQAEQDGTAEPLKLKQIIKIPGARQVMGAFFCYCALEQTAALWSASYLNLHAGFTPEVSASLGSLFFLGITVGRAASGFISIRYNNNQMIQSGFVIIATGITLLLLPLGHWGAILGLLMIGLGCAPVYPCMMHSTPELFGAEQSQAIMGIQTASAYVGTALMPPLFGLIANHLSISMMSLYLMIILLCMMFCHKKTSRIRTKQPEH